MAALPTQYATQLAPFDSVAGDVRDSSELAVSPVVRVRHPDHVTNRVAHFPHPVPEISSPRKGNSYRSRHRCEERGSIRARGTSGDHRPCSTDIRASPSRGSPLRDDPPEFAAEEGQVVEVPVGALMDRDRAGKANGERLGRPD